MRLLLCAVLSIGCGNTLVAVDASDDAATSDGDAQPALCDASTSCSSDMICDIGCGIFTYPTECTSRPKSCDGGDRVCGCDGIIHESACEAHAAGTSVASSVNACPPPPSGLMECGSIYCDVATTYCQHVGGPVPNPYACNALPPSCVGRSDCACFDGGTCGTCQVVGDGGFLWSCAID